MNAYTAKELERVVLKRISSEICCNSRMPTNICPIPKRGPGGVGTSNVNVHVVEGGRWLLSISQKRDARRVFAYDLDKPFPQDPQCIIELKPSNPEPYWFICTDVDPTEATLTFNLALIPDHTFPGRTSDNTIPLPEIHIYRICLKGHGSQAMLKARWTKSLRISGKELTVIHCFYGYHFARALEGVSFPKRCIEVCNWSLSDLSVHTKSYIFFSGPFPVSILCWLLFSPLY